MLQNGLVDTIKGMFKEMIFYVVEHLLNHIVMYNQLFQTWFKIG
jgi:hypothetical protein